MAMSRKPLMSLRTSTELLSRALRLVSSDPFGPESGSTRTIIIRTRAWQRRYLLRCSSTSSVRPSLLLTWCQRSIPTSPHRMTSYSCAANSSVCCHEINYGRLRIESKAFGRFSRLDTFKWEELVKNADFRAKMVSHIDSLPFITFIFCP